MSELAHVEGIIVYIVLAMKLNTCFEQYWDLWGSLYSRCEVAIRAKFAQFSDSYTCLQDDHYGGKYKWSVEEVYI